jgi:peptidyl-prolyl cis-trans isomerase SurA
MKKQLVFVVSLSLLIVAKVKAQTVFTYGKKMVEKEEFLRAFNKNPNNSGDRKAQLKEYLDLYINFKLKVVAAYEAKVDQMATQQEELANFRRQIVDNYVNEEANSEQLVNEAFERSKKDLHVAQIFIEAPRSNDKDSMAVKINEAHGKLKSGMAWGNVLAQYATDKNDDIGWITVFTLGYELESVVYGLKPGEFSKPVRTKWGWHILKLLEERPAVGKVKVSQIMVALPQNGSAEERDAVKKKADSIYLLTKNGGKFGALAKELSNDRSSYMNEGQLAEFGVGQYDPAFEQAAFALRKQGDVSAPVLTANGYHIILLNEKLPVNADKNDALFMANLKQQVTNDKRMEKSRMLLIAQKLKLVGYKPVTIDRKLLYEYTDSFQQGKTTRHLVTLRDSLVLHSFKKQNVLVIDWCRFVRAIRASVPRYNDMSYEEIMNDYINITAGEYYKAHLEEFSNPFKLQLQEFKEANLLFEIMDRNVWSKAAADSAGLAKHYAANKAKYLWGPSANAIIVTCANQALADSVKEKLQKNVRNWKGITEGYGQQVIADSNRFELPQIPVVERTAFAPGLFTAPVTNQQDGTVTFSYIINVMKEPAQRSFEDARGFVISDYQLVLEQNWLAMLKKKYPVKVNQKNFSGL